MKVYTVTDGEYSDYTIEKVFSNKPAAEEYRKWHNITNAIEEYEVYDEPFEQSDGEKVMLIRVEGKVYPEAVVGINYTIRPDVIPANAKKRGVGFGSVGFNDYYTLYLYRYVPAGMWDEEKCKAKYTKALCDLAGIAKAMLADGASVYDVERALRDIKEEE